MVRSSKIWCALRISPSKWPSKPIEVGCLGTQFPESLVGTRPWAPPSPQVGPTTLKVPSGILLSIHLEWMGMMMWHGPGPFALFDAESLHLKICLNLLKCPSSGLINKINDFLIMRFLNFVVRLESFYSCCNLQLPLIWRLRK